MGKLEWWGYPRWKNFEVIYNRLDSIAASDRRTDRRTSCGGIVRAMHTRRLVKINININFRRRRSLLSEGDILCFSARSIFFVFLLMWQRSNGWTDFQQIFTNRCHCGAIRWCCYPMKIGPTVFLRPSWRFRRCSHFGDYGPRFLNFCHLLRRRVCRMLVAVRILTSWSSVDERRLTKSWDV